MSRKARISAETFQAAIQTIRKQDETAGASGRRHATRVRMEGTAKIILCRAGVRRIPVEVAVHDLSSLGIGINCTEAMKAGERFILLLDAAGTRASQAILCQVARWQPLHDGLFAIGAAFVRELDMPANRRMPAGVTEALSSDEQEEVRKFEQRLAAFLG